MKKCFLILLASFVLVSPVFAEEVEETAVPEAVEAAIEAVGEVAPVAEPAVVLAPESPAPDNLEFVSGEISGVDEMAKSITVKLYGDTEDGASEKILTLTVDEATDVTDGEKDRDLKSLTAGTEVDVEYDPKTNKSTYIFVY